jgi:nucleoside-diphosphate-sugar epimerase
LGFIGANLALALARAGADVTVVDACYPRHGANPYNLEAEGGDRIRRVTADLGDAAVRAALDDVELVFNLAGQVSHVDSMTDPIFDLDVNTRSQVAFLEALRWASPAATVVFTSTRQLFGRPRYLPVDEDHPVNPVDVNGITKHAAEQFHTLYHEVYGLRTSVVRLTNVFGPRQRLRDDFQGFLPIFVRRALLGQQISLFGDGSQERDCLYVDDVVDCLVRAALTEDAVGEGFNAPSRRFRGRPTATPSTSGRTSGTRPRPSAPSAGPRRPPSPRASSGRWSSTVPTSIGTCRT